MNWVTETVDIINTVGGGIGDAVAAVATTGIGGFLIGVYIMATAVRAVWNKVRNG